MNDLNEYCEIHYTLNGDTDKAGWSLIGRYTTPDRIQNSIYIFDENADNNQVGIFLFANTGTSGDCCRIRDWSLTGIPIPTMSPTKDPFQTPTNQPSESPSTSQPQSR